MPTLNLCFPRLHLPGVGIGGRTRQALTKIVSPLVFFCRNAEGTGEEYSTGYDRAAQPPGDAPTLASPDHKLCLMLPWLCFSE